MYDFCAWCFQQVPVKEDHDYHKTKVYCCWPCYYADKYFRKYNSDIEVEMRLYFDGEADE